MINNTYYAFILNCNINQRKLSKNCTIITHVNVKMSYHFLPSGLIKVDTSDMTQ